MSEVVKPACEIVGLWSQDAGELLLGTACQESGCGRYLRQLGGGPALGIFQMEPATYRDIWANYLRYQESLAAKVIEIAGHVSPAPDVMIWNLRFAAAMARVHYRRVPEKLPTAGNLSGQARYWKQYFNTPLGKGTVQEYVENWGRYVGKEDA